MNWTWAIGKAGHEHWGDVPVDFDERYSRLVCACGLPMFRVSSNHRRVGYSDKDKQPITVEPL